MKLLFAGASHSARRLVGAAVDEALCAMHRLGDLATSPVILEFTDAIGIGDRCRLIAAVGYAHLQRPLDAWRTWSVVRERSGPTVRTIRAEARILSLLHENRAARACLAEAVVPGVATLPSDAASPAARARAADWSDLDPVSALRRLPRGPSRRMRLLGLLQRRRRHAAAAWWARRINRRFEEAEALLASGAYDAAEALVPPGGRDRPSALDLRILGEVLVRQGDLAGFDRLLTAATRHVPRRRRGLSPFAWLMTYSADHPAPTELLPRDLVERVLELAARLDSAHVQKRLAILFDHPFGRRLRVLEGACATFSRPVSGVNANTEPSRDLAEATAVIDTLLGRGDIVAAEQVALRYADRRLDEAGSSIGAAEVGSLAGRFPASLGLIDRLAELARRDGRDDLVRAVTGWAARVEASDWSNLVGSATGRRCVIVGNGPSLAELPLERLHGVDLICVNRGLEATALGLPPPRHLVVADGLVYGRHKRVIDRSPVERLFLHGNCVWALPANLPDTVVPFGTSGFRFSQRPLEFAPWAFHRGDTVMVVAVQIAVVLGYTDIAIIGVDLDYSGTRTHFYGGTAGDRDLLASFRPGGTGIAVANAAFANLATTVRRRGVRLVNAGSKGNLIALPRLSLVEFVARGREYGTARRWNGALAM